MQIQHMLEVNYNRRVPGYVWKGVWSLGITRRLGGSTTIDGTGNVGSLTCFR